MESYRTEEEQVEALKKWWDENGRSTMAAVALALAAGFGWQFWQEHRSEQAEQASVVYEEMLTAMREASQGGESAKLKTLAERVKADYPSSHYDAEQELRWVLTRGPETELRLLAELRLARVKTSQGQPREALDILSATEPGAFEPAYAEAEGDAWLALGDTDKASAAYERALAAAAAGNAGASESLRLKLGALTPVPARELAPALEE